MKSLILLLASLALAPSMRAQQHSGLLEPQGLDLESWREEEGVLRVAAVVSAVALTADDTDCTITIDSCNPW